MISIGLDVDWALDNVLLDCLDFLHKYHIFKKNWKLVSITKNLYDIFISKKKCSKKKFGKLKLMIRSFKTNDYLKKIFRNKKYKGAWFRDGLNNTGCKTASHRFDFNKKRCFYSIELSHSKNLNKSIDFK